MVTLGSVKSATAEASTIRPERGYFTGRAQRIYSETGETFNIKCIVCGDGEKESSVISLGIKLGIRAHGLMAGSRYTTI